QLISSIYGMQAGMNVVLEGMDSAKAADDGDKGKAADGDVDVAAMADQAPVVKLVNSILSQAIKDGASDVHISPEKSHTQIRFRVDGKLHEIPAPPKSMFQPIVSRFKILGNMDIANARVPQDGRFTVKMQNREINIRASTLPTIYGENVVLRLLDTSSNILTLDQIGLTLDNQNKVKAMVYKPYGMILTSGPTGSGKSTTLFAILQEINKPDINIITLEDPVEFRIENLRQVQLNRKAGMTFSGGLKSILRQDPDVVMVGEIRDSETATISVQAALTGHRVLSTLHTNDAAGAITRFIDMGTEPFLVASVMLVTIGQRLVRKICPNCQEPHQPPESAVRFWGLDKKEGSPHFQKGKGCYSCMDTGYKGRVGLYEVLTIDEEVQDMIIRKQSSKDITRAVRDNGKLVTLQMDAAEKIFAGLTTIEEAASAVMS
ncbi:GspE/PulE family protein, partial [Desulfobacterales bacterium HSG17]|nr:GspE/PulE family protein [Desulfobacterales bacterium HSG17]